MFEKFREWFDALVNDCLDRQEAGLAAEDLDYYEYVLDKRHTND